MKNQRAYKAYKLLLVLLGGTLVIPASQAVALPPTTIPGAMCQAYDEAALKPGELIRTTAGITNKSSKTIKIYCPVNTDTAKSTLKIILDYNSDAPKFKTGTDTYGLPLLKCFARYGSKPHYKKFTHLGLGKNSATLSVKTFAAEQVTIKCTLKPGGQIKSIFSE